MGETETEQPPVRETPVSPGEPPLTSHPPLETRPHTQDGKGNAQRATRLPSLSPQSSVLSPHRFVAGLLAWREPLFLFLLSRVALSFLAGYAYLAFVPMFEVPAPGYDRPALDRLQEVLLGVWQ